MLRGFTWPFACSCWNGSWKELGAKKRKAMRGSRGVRGAGPCSRTKTRTAAAAQATPGRPHAKSKSKSKRDRDRGRGRGRDQSHAHVLDLNLNRRESVKHALVAITLGLEATRISPAEAKLVIPRRNPSTSYAERKQRIKDAERRREEKEQEEDDNLGPIQTLPSGIQYRDIAYGETSGPEAQPNSTCDIAYTVYRLAPGAYFKYSSGGTPIYLFSLGYGNEGKDDVGSTFTFTLGSKGAVPPAVSNVMLGMHRKGIRRVLIPPYFGWNTDAELELQPDTFGGQRRLENHKMEPLLMDVELVKIRQKGSRPEASSEDLDETLNLESKTPFRLPEPPRAR